MSSPRLVEDLQENHGRSVHRSFVQTLAEAVGSIALLKAENWHYQTPKLAVPIATVSIGVDGTCLLLCEGGFRQAMVGTISLYDEEGDVNTQPMWRPVLNMDEPHFWNECNAKLNR